VEFFQAGFFVTIFMDGHDGGHMSETKSTARYRPETRLVHSGALRSQFGETSEALFLTQGFIYDSAEQCEARFKGEDPGFLYSRFSNPNISMFERRMIELEGAEAARATATGMAAVTTAILAPLKAGDHVVAAKAMFGSCRYVVEDLLPRYGISSRWSTVLISTSGSAHCGRTPSPSSWRARPIRRSTCSTSRRLPRSRTVAARG
jgi:O-succinylhomoserine sulfhydrylase